MLVENTFIVKYPPQKLLLSPGHGILQLESGNCFDFKGSSLPQKHSTLK